MKMKAAQTIATAHVGVWVSSLVCEPLPPDTAMAFFFSFSRPEEDPEEAFLKFLTN